MSDGFRLEGARRLHAVGSASATRRTPFKFLDAYEREDADIFFGRDGEIEKLRGRFYRGRVLTVYGESGAGKTSLVQCGLANVIPAEDADFVTIRCNVAPLQAARRLFEAEPDASLANIVETYTDERSRTVVLVFDQFEELFLFQPESVRAELLEELSAALRRKLDLKVIFCIREEYFARMTEVEKVIPDLFASRFWLRRMGDHEAREAIEGPCRRLGVELDPGLADGVLDRLRDAHHEVDLPYLQIVLDRLYRLADERGEPLQLINNDLKALGAMEDILFQFLEERVAAFPDPDLGRDVLKTFVTAARTRRAVDAPAVFEEVARTRPDSSEESIRELLLALVGVRILRQETGDASFELRHDTLAEAISRWLTPIEEERLRIRQIVESRFAEHEGTGALIEDVALLEKIEPFLPHLGLPAPVRDFVTRSRTAMLAARRRRARTVVVAVAVLFAVLSGLTAWSLVNLWEAKEQALRAEQEREAAETRALVAEAQRRRALGKPFQESLALLRAAARPGATRKAKKLAAIHGLLELAHLGADRVLPVQGEIGDPIAFSPDGRFLAVPTSLAGRASYGVVELWDVVTGVKLRPLNHDNNTNGLAFSPDGSLLATWNILGNARFWDTRTGTLFRKLEYPHDACSVAFAPDGSLVATIRSVKGPIELWDARTLSFVKSLGDERARQVIFSPDSKQLMTASHYGKNGTAVRLWDVGTGTSRNIFEREDVSLGALSFSPEGEFLAATLGINGVHSVLVWNVSTGALIEQAKDVNTFAFSPDGHLLAVLADDETRVWDIRSHTRVATLGKGVNWLAFSSDSRFLATQSPVDSMLLWDVETGALVKTLGKVRSFALAPKGSLLATRSEDNTVRLWDARPGSLLRALELPTTKPDYSTSLAFSPNGEFLASGTDGKAVKLWETGSGSLVRTFEGDDWSVSYLAFSADDGYLLTGSVRKVRTWEVGTKEPLKTFGGERVIAVSPDGKRLVKQLGDKSAEVMDTRTGAVKELQDFRCSGHWSLSHNGGLFACASYDSVRLWNAATGEVLGTTEHLRKKVDALAFSPDGELLTTGSEDNTARLWDTDSAKLRANLEGHSGSVVSLAFSPDGQLLATGSSDRTARLWDVGTGQHLETLEGHEGSVMPLEFSADGGLLATASSSRTDHTTRVRLWDVSTGAFVRALEVGHAFWSAKLTFSPDGKLLEHRTV